MVNDETTETRCKHCGMRISSDTYPVHREGGSRGKQRCDPKDSGLRYGFNADPIGAECNAICVGSVPGS
jgi:hypothetical protein